MLGWIGWLIARARRRKAKEARRVERRAAAQAAPPPVPAVPRATPQPPAHPAPPPAPSPSGDPIGFELRPLAISVAEQGVVLEYDLLIGNLGDRQLEGIRVSLAMISANPAQDNWIESFHAVPANAPVAQNVVLEPRSGGKIGGKTMLGFDRIHVVDVGGRKMFVPIVMVDARWRGGLSIRQTGADFMVGTAGQGMKLGPIWLDRGATRVEGLAANRYFRKSQVQAAE